MDIIAKSRKISFKLSRYLQAIAYQKFNFRGDPIRHSFHKHVHLWMIEYLAHDHPQINLRFRLEAVDFIFSNWKKRLKSCFLYKRQGYCFYLYWGLEPTISVVAETAIGFLYFGEWVQVTDHDEILVVYSHQSRRSYFDSADIPNPKNSRDVIEASKGSISHPVAEKLGLNRAGLGQWIENLGLGNDLNQIRNRYYRPPAHFEDPDLSDAPHTYYKEIIAPGY